MTIEDIQNILKASCSQYYGSSMESEYHVNESGNIEFRLKVIWREEIIFQEVRKAHNLEAAKKDCYETLMWNIINYGLEAAYKDIQNITTNEA